MLLPIPQVNEEPGEYSSTSATAKYTVTVSGLTSGAAYRLYRTTGLFAGHTIPKSAAALASVCTSQGAGCVSAAFTATGPSMTFTEAQLGGFAATG